MLVTVCAPRETTSRVLAATADGKSTMWFDSTSLVCVRSFPASFFDFLTFSSKKMEEK
jgi:hypothetical protein